MTPEQITSLRAKVFADSAANTLLTAGDSSGLRTYLNAAVSAFIVWRTSVSQDEIMGSAAFDWTRVDNLSVGKARIWEWLFKNSGISIDPSQANKRAGIDAAWVGTTADLNVRAAVYVKCKRSATMAEKMLATGTGTDATPAVMDLQGEVSDNDTARIIFKDNGQIWTVGG
jgi:hypothetical protein